jgi:hypothetical protein
VIAAMAFRMIFEVMSSTYVAKNQAQRMNGRALIFAIVCHDYDGDVNLTATVWIVNAL